MGSGDVTRLIQRWKVDGDAEAEAALFLTLEGEFLKIARAALRRMPDMAHKIQPDELMSEAYMALRDYPVETWGRGPFFALMSRAMRHFLIDLARHDAAEKRPRTAMRVVDTNVVDQLAAPQELSPIDFYRVLDELAAENPDPPGSPLSPRLRQARAVELRILGLENTEIASELGVSLATLKRDLAHARAFFALKLGLGPRWLSA